MTGFEAALPVICFRLFFRSDFHASRGARPWARGRRKARLKIVGMQTAFFASGTSVPELPKRGSSGTDGAGFHYGSG